MSDKIFCFLCLLAFVAFVLACTLILGGYGLFVWGPVVIYIINRSYEPDQANDPNE